MPWLRVGLTLLLLCGMILPRLMAAFSKFSWTDLVVQLFFAQSHWSIHEMSRAYEKHFLWDFDDTHVAEYQEQVNSQVVMAQPELLEHILYGPARASTTLPASTASTK